MGRFFNIDNPIWKFIGNLADLFILSMLWYLSCIPVVTLGSGTTALYYVTLKMASNQEGYTWKGFWHSLRGNLKQGIIIWLIFLAMGIVIGIDFYWCLVTGTLPAKAMFVTLIVVSLLYLLNFTFIFPLLARCENSVSALLKMCFAMSIRNFFPLLSTILLTAGLFALGIFVFWPVLLIAPGLAAYGNSFVFNHCLGKYGFSLPN